MDNLGVFLQIIFWGLYAGCIYILLATGLNLIFGVMKVVNFAHGEFLMIGAYITATIFFITGINPYLIILLSMLALIVIGALVERLCFRPILGTGKLNEIFLSIGLIYVIQNGAALIWTDNWQSIRSPYDGITLPVGSLDVPLDYILIMVLTGVILCGLYLFLKKTTIGMQMQATSQNRKGAMLVGINVERIDVISFGLGCALAAAAGTLWVVSGQVFNRRSRPLRSSSLVVLAVSPEQSSAVSSWALPRMVRHFSWAASGRTQYLLLSLSSSLSYGRPGYSERKRSEDTCCMSGIAL